MAKKLIYEVGVGVRLIPVSSLETGFRKGDLQVLNSDSKLYFDNGSAHLAVVTETGAATLTGKTYSAVNGSASSPSFTFDNSSTTGLYRVSADVIGLTVAGTARAQLNASTLSMYGAIESGVASSVNGSLSVFNSAGSNSLVASMPSNTESRIASSGSSNITLYTNGSERTRFTSDGFVRIGTTSTLVFNNERLSVNYSAPGITDNAFSGGAGIIQNSDTAVTASVRQYGSFARFRRTTTVSLTDTNTHYSGSAVDVVFTTSSSTTYTNTSTEGINGILVNTPLQTGAGSLAISNFHGIQVLSNSLATGTNKYGLRIGDQSGSTNNFALFTGTGLNRLGDSVDIRGTTINTTLTGSSASLNLQKNTSSGEGAIMSSGTGGNNFLTFYTSASAAAVERLRLTSSGDVEVRGGTLSVYHSGLGGNTLNFSKPTTSESRITSVGVTSLTFYTNSDERLVIDSSGNVKMKAQLQIEDPGAGTNQVNIQSPSGLASSYTLTLPVDDGTPNQFLITDGSGNLSWTSTVAGSGLYSFSGSYVAPNSLAAAATLTSGADSRRISYVIGSGGAVTLSTTTPVSAGTSSGQELVIIGTSDINTVTVPMSGNVILKAACVLGQYDSVSLAWDAVSSLWIEIGRNF